MLLRNACELLTHLKNFENNFHVNVRKIKQKLTRIEINIMKTTTIIKNYAFVILTKNIHNAHKITTTKNSMMK